MLPASLGQVSDIFYRRVEGVYLPPQRQTRSNQTEGDKSTRRIKCCQENIEKVHWTHIKAAGANSGDLSGRERGGFQRLGIRCASIAPMPIQVIRVKTSSFRLLLATC